MTRHRLSRSILPKKARRGACAIRLKELLLRVYHAITDLRWPVLFALLAVAAVLATISHLLLARGLKLVDVSLVQPAEFLRLVWSSILGFLLFDEVPGITLWIGSAVVIAGVWLAARRALGERVPARTHS